MSEEISESREQSILDELAHSETVRKLIECPVCLELPLPPIYVCNKGHIVCNNCQARTYACPLCREHYSTTRGFVAEGIIEKCLLRCKNSDQGCPLTMRGSSMVDHLEICDYRPVKCVDCAGKLINFDEYEDHLLKYHQINGINQSRAYVIYSMNLAHQIAFGEKCCWPQYYLKAFGDVTFLLRLYATHWFVCAWISLLGPKADCAKYETLLEFHPTNDDSIIHTWQGPVNHFRDDPAKEIFLQGKGLITPMETLMHIAPVANDHAEWIYNIEILQVSPTDNKPETQDNEAGTSNPAEDKPSQVEPAESEVSQGLPTDNATGLNEREETVDPEYTPIPQPQLQPTSSPTPTATCPHVISSTISSNSPRRVPACPPLRTPPATGIARLSTVGITSTPRNAQVLSPGPITFSPSTSVLAAAAATITSAVPTSTGRGPQASQQPASYSLFSSTFSSGNPTSNNTGATGSIGSGPLSVTTAASQPSSRLLSTMRRASAFCSYYTSGNRAYGFNEEDWNISSESDEEG